jgi:hypothetical protein
MDGTTPGVDKGNDDEPTELRARKDDPDSSNDKDDDDSLIPQVYHPDIWTPPQQRVHGCRPRKEGDCSHIVQYSTVQYSTVQCSTVQYSTVQCSTVQCSTVQFSTVQCSTVQYSAVQSSTVVQ